jgi:hypothetical protein
VAEPDDHVLDTLVAVDLVTVDPGLGLLGADEPLGEREQEHHESLAASNGQVDDQVRESLDEVVPTFGAQQPPSLTVGQLRQELEERISTSHRPP